MTNFAASDIGDQTAKGFPLASQPPTVDTDVDEEVTFYEQVIPEFAEVELERLYCNIMTTLARFSIYKAAPEASTYVVRRHGAVHTVILFKLEHRHVKVYNEQVKMAQADITKFVGQIFSRYPSVTRVSFYAIDSDAAAIPYPHMEFESLEDIVVRLPETEIDYLARLEKHTRSSIKRRHMKLLRDFPTFRFDTVSKDTVTTEQIEKIVGFSQARMLAKGERCYHTRQSTENLLALARKYGVIHLAMIDGQVCGGVVDHRLGIRQFAHIASHDPKLDQYGLGILCNYLAICSAIADGIKYLHFGWGRSDYKYRLLGRNQALFSIDVYRDQISKMAHIPHIVRMVRTTKVRHLKLWLSDVQHGKAGNKHLARIIGLLRAFKRGLSPTNQANGS